MLILETLEGCGLIEIQVFWAQSGALVPLLQCGHQNYKKGLMSEVN